MANPSAAHEPSMEEILASIRQIISEDGEGSQAQQGKGEESEETTATAETAHQETFDDAAAEPQQQEPQTIESDIAETSAEADTGFEPEPEPQSIYAHGESMTPPSGSAAAESYAPFAASAAPQAEPATRAQSSAAREEHHLLSAQSDEAVHGAFSALAHTILAQNARTLEDLVAEMLQPMLKSWLDDNLPALVERLVQEEIQRVSRGRP